MLNFVTLKKRFFKRHVLSYCTNIRVGDTEMFVDKRLGLRSKDFMTHLSTKKQMELEHTICLFDPSSKHQTLDVPFIRGHMQHI